MQRAGASWTEQAAQALREHASNSGGQQKRFKILYYSCMRLSRREQDGAAPLLRKIIYIDIGCVLRVGEAADQS
ncbi:hypothetical protein CQ13_34315 [Bradyrhizobium retamae]|uniref:Uncharacterized protein n=1 Tax=Bradyrhizobium retamae TaxID=1300035 RepID=A0A0R3MFV9_9BRAD|nr:hypothetical protein CQ13_34315 [Bradyrhizobium retamae]